MIRSTFTWGTSTVASLPQEGKGEDPSPCLTRKTRIQTGDRVLCSKTSKVYLAKGKRTSKSRRRAGPRADSCCLSLVLSHPRLEVGS